MILDKNLEPAVQDINNMGGSSEACEPPDTECLQLPSPCEGE